MKQIILLLSVLSLAWASDIQEDLIKDLEQNLIAPCCWSGTVYDHGHPEMEKEIRQMVEGGQTRQEIIDHFLARYGERILASPVASGFNLMAWITPIIIGLIGIAVFLNYLRTPKAVADGKLKPKSDLKIPYDDQIERELKALD